jgi:cytochrome c553
MEGSMASRGTKNWVWWLLTVSATLVVAVALFGIVAYVRGSGEVTAHREVEGLLTDASGGDVKRGAHLVTTLLACRDCHADDLGGKIVGDERAFALFAAPNITGGEGGLKDYTLADWDRALRHGVGQDGKALLQMPAIAYTSLSDRDVASVAAYMNTVPPVDRELPESELRTVGRIMAGIGRFPIYADQIDHAAVGDGANNMSQGRYLAEVAGCFACHGSGLSGKQVNPQHYAPPITREALRSWSNADFERLMREGLNRDGTPISDFMPWKSYRDMTDEELDVLWAFLKPGG